MLWRRCAYLVLVSICTPLCSQTANPPDSATPTFKSKVQLVLVDVVVTDGKDRPITGLQKDDFEIFEGTGSIGAGERQSIVSFEEHKSNLATIEPPRSPGPNVYTNAPAIAAADSINVLLLDALNTTFEDQTTVRRRMIGYLKTINPGPRLAIFTLGSRLQMVEGFSSDPRALLVALDHKDWGGKPQASTPVRTDAEDAARQTLLQQISDTFAGHADLQAAQAIQALQNFLDEEKATEQVTRTSVTLEALRQLSQYLNGFPGRKNVIWFSGSFPSISVSSLGQLRPDLGLEGELKETINLLAAAQVAVYPVAAQGLETQPLFQASQLAPSVVGAGKSQSQKAIEGMNQRMDQDSTARVLNTGAADEIASNTGGKAFYNNNGLKESLAAAVQNGSHYYSLSYSPSDKRTLGRYRRIEVKLRNGRRALAYRRGYFEENQKQLAGEKDEPATGRLQRLLQRGLPDSTQIVFKLGVRRMSERPATATTVAGDNAELHGPVTRLSADFVIPVENLDFEITGDGIRHGNLELALVAYDHNGSPLNWLFRSIKASLKPELYPGVQKNGAGFHQEIDIPAGENYLRAGIYDLRSNKAGTLEIPLSTVTPADNATTTQDAGTRGDSSRSPSTAPATIPFSPELIATLTASTGNTVGRASDPGSAPEGDGSSIPSGPASTSQQMNEPEPADIEGYCATLTGTSENAPALAKACEFALSMPKKLPDVICERKTKRYWKTPGDETLFQRAGKVDFDDENHADVITAKVTYRDGYEYYEDIHIDGKPADAAAPWSSGAWSIGEFALSLNTIFMPSGKPEFRYAKQEKLRSIPALVFEFHISAENNKRYFLRSGDKVWFPDLHGRIWLDKGSFRLLKLERETAYMPDDPIRRMKTTTDYSVVALGDGTNMVLPTHADALVCAPARHSPFDNCARNIVTFTKWQKFRAKAKIILNPN